MYNSFISYTSFIFRGTTEMVINVVHQSPVIRIDPFVTLTQIVLLIHLLTTSGNVNVAQDFMEMVNNARKLHKVMKAIELLLQKECLSLRFSSSKINPYR